jgi:WD40 repeat protein
MMNGFGVVGHTDGTISVWNLATRKIMTAQKLHSAEVRGVSYSVDGKYIASASFDS